MSTVRLIGKDQRFADIDEWPEDNPEEIRIQFKVDRHFHWNEHGKPKDPPPSHTERVFKKIGVAGGRSIYKEQ